MSAAGPVTPLRPTPGNYIATPGPNRAPVPQPPDFGRRTSTFTQSQQQNGAPVGPGQMQPVEQPRPGSSSSTMTAAQRAARVINDTINLDAKYPELETYIVRECLTSLRSTRDAWELQLNFMNRGNIQRL